MLCHGNGDLDKDGCCYVAGQVCPLRWKISGGHVYDATGADLGTVATFVASYAKSKAAQQAITDQLQGVTYVCSVVATVLSNNTKLLTDRAGLEAAWLADANYSSQVAPLWRQVEQSSGLATGTLDCPKWKGTGGAQCCFAEDATTNASHAAGLSANGKAVRQAGGI